MRYELRIHFICSYRVYCFVYLWHSNRHPFDSMIRLITKRFCRDAALHKKNISASKRSSDHLLIDAPNYRFTTVKQNIQLRSTTEKVNTLSETKNAIE